MIFIKVNILLLELCHRSADTPPACGTGRTLTDYNDRTDEELVRAIQKGDNSAFETLYFRYRDWVVSLAYRFCGHREDALDVLQETFAYFLRKLPGLELRSQMKTFLYPPVKHLALARKAAARKHAPLEEAADPPAKESPPSEVEDEVEDIVRRLPDEQREVVWLRFVDGLALKQIAEVLGIPLGTVKSRLHGALEALRRKKSENL